MKNRTPRIPVFATDHKGERIGPHSVPGATLAPGTKLIPITRQQSEMLAGLNQRITTAQNELTIAVNMILASRGVSEVQAVGLAGSPKAPMLAYLEVKKPHNSSGSTKNESR